MGNTLRAMKDPRWRVVSTMKSIRHILKLKEPDWLQQDLIFQIDKSTLLSNDEVFQAINNLYLNGYAYACKTDIVDFVSTLIVLDKDDYDKVIVLMARDDIKKLRTKLNDTLVNKLKAIANINNEEKK